MKHVFTAACVSALCVQLNAADWLQFRGPGGTGVSPEANLPLQLDAKSITWKIPLTGRGLSSPVIVGDRVYVTACSGTEQDRLHVICFRLKDGAKVWERQFWATGRTMSHPKTSVAANSPCSDGKRLFCLFSSNDLLCLDLDGNLLWLRGLGRDYPNASNSLGMAASPIVVGDTLVVPVENDSESFSAGIDVETGANRWKRDRPKMASWTTPVLVPDAKSGTPLVALQSGPGLSVVDVRTGQEAWYFTDGASTMSSSVFTGGVLYVPSKGMAAMKPGAAGAHPETIWQNSQLTPNTASPIVLGDKLFTLNSAGILSAADIKDGKRLWQLRTTGPYSATPVGFGKHLYLVNEKGLVQVVDTSALEGAVVSKLDLTDTIIGTPSIGGGAVFIRSDKALVKLGGS
ncbi:MAG: pyrrolo-quinoline quinone [Proteobacteria bacterium]|nr:pyrrolo-quinoline quinone [Pseudomonadota bacterium]